MREIKKLFSEQLNRIVTLHIILPEGYTKKTQYYPVLYFYDGNRIYDDPCIKGPSALNGSFNFEQYYQAFHKFLPQIIIVGITPPDNMWERTAEYSPYTKHFHVPEGINFSPYVQGKGKELGDWVVLTLKPWIDSMYRTQKDAAYTAIGGLSTSGVNALYMAATYPQIFRRFLIHAPASHLWIEEIRNTLHAANFSHIKYGYFDIGTDDCTRMVENGKALQDLQEIITLMKRNGLSETALRFFQTYRGTHECLSWALTFPDALRWIFQDIYLP